MAPHLWYEGGDDGVLEQHLVAQQADGVQQVLLLRLELTVQALHLRINLLHTQQHMQLGCATRPCQHHCTSNLHT